MEEFDLNGINLLIVDDEELILDTLGEILKLNGANVSVCSNGNEAFEQMKIKRFQIVLSDIRMPGCSGIELLKKVREEKTIKMPPILLMSAFTDISTDKAKELGAQGMFLKDSDSKYLKQMIYKVVKG